jgi:quinol-cytochrome oxidoreductase complex cytochrome b subunit
MDSKTIYSRIIEWIDSRIGITKTILRPAPEYAMHPFYWIGGLAVIALIIQGLTGIFMLLYYVPNTDQAYSSTVYIMKSVPLGLLVETLHLYTAYAMILLAFAHMMRNFFASAHKMPRELMWLVGMIMGFVVLSFGLTGYLLPWTVVSKSATDVAIGMLNVLPTQIGNIVKFLAAGSGSDAAELDRFLTVHTVLLPVALLSLLAVKLYMFEVHGSPEPATGVKFQARELPWFPNVFLYLTMIGVVFVAVMLAVSAVFPLVLPPEFSPQAAAAYVSQPDWYFLWMYQILKFAPMEGPGIYYALGGITLFMALLTLLPFYDRGIERNPASRPLFVTIGAIMVSELAALTIWGYLTPGQVIPGVQAAAVTGGVAVMVLLLSWILFRIRRRPRTRSVGGGLGI